MKRILIATVLALAMVLVPVSGLAAATTADITITATPAYIAITCDQSSYDFGVVTASSTPSTATTWATVTNQSTVETDQTIAVTTTTWSGGVTWAHSESATAGADQAGLLANRGGTWGVSDITIKNASPNYLYENKAAGGTYQFGLKLVAPTSFNDGAQKTITVRISAVAS